MSIRSKKGMTLVEVVVSMVIVTIAVVSLFAAVTQSSVLSKRSGMGYTLTNIALRRIEVLKRLDSDMLPFAEESGIQVSSDGNVSSTGEYFRTTEITQNYNENPYLTKAKVTARKVKLDTDGTITTPLAYQGDPVVIETIIADI
ncbi:MAG: prepilin-type N-terminal cleavage/methylation domain-containing protein [Candidatus Omnitrophica bacterium]|nr:prepilin-type N-terminal cleavage/methylation domain-containing protein [Candidatus Omnitrophota bacterium]